MHAAMAHCRRPGPDDRARGDGWPGWQHALCRCHRPPLGTARPPSRAAVAVPRRPSAEAAADTLAAIHLALATLPGYPPHRAESGVARRRGQAAALLQRPGRASGDDARRGRPAEPRVAGRCDHGHGGCPAARSHSRFDPGPVTVQPVLRDVWSDHLLFVGSRVTGVIDSACDGHRFTPATDTRSGSSAAGRIPVEHRAGVPRAA